MYPPERQYKYFYDKLCGTGSYKSNTGGYRHIYQYECDRVFGTYRQVTSKNTGGYDNKYRKLRGIGDYSKPKVKEQRRRKQSEISNDVRDVHEGQRGIDKGEYP